MATVNPNPRIWRSSRVAAFAIDLEHLDLITPKTGGVYVLVFHGHPFETTLSPESALELVNAWEIYRSER